MKEIPVGGEGLVALVDDEDYPTLARFDWRPLASPANQTFYAVRPLTGREDNKRVDVTVFMHRLIIPCRPGMVIDHRDRNGLNNQKANLRECTSSQNAANSSVQQREKSSRFKGVSRRKDGSWVAKIKKDQRPVYYARFASEETAALAYDAKARELFGEFARFNFPLDGERSALI